MTESPRPDEPARAALAVLLPLRDSLARRAGALRVELARAEPLRSERLYARALRCDRVVGLLDSRIRLAAEQLARGALASSSGEAG
jgi:hypothetical protein